MAELARVCGGGGDDDEGCGEERGGKVEALNVDLDDFFKIGTEVSRILDGTVEGGGAKLTIFKSGNASLSVGAHTAILRTVGGLLDAKDVLLFPRHPLLNSANKQSGHIGP